MMEAFCGLTTAALSIMMACMAGATEKQIDIFVVGGAL
jgi:hypothetical protein